jgi:hypothetical protein
MVELFTNNPVHLLVYFGQIFPPYQCFSIIYFVPDMIESNDKIKSRTHTRSGYLFTEIDSLCHEISNQALIPQHSIPKQKTVNPGPSKDQQLMHQAQKFRTKQ